MQNALDAIRRNPGRHINIAAIRRGSVTPSGSMFGSPNCKTMTLITPHIVIGAREDAEDLTGLKAMGISHIINLTSVIPCHFPEHFVYLHLPVQGT